MTVAPRRDPLPFETIDDIAAAIRAAGGRLSSARRIVLDVLFAADGPISAERIAGGLDGRMTKSDLSSVYRNLEHLEELGVVRHVHLPHGPGLYTLERDTEYLVCERCERVETVAAERLDEVRGAIRRSFGYHARFSHFPIVGLCAACAEGGDAGHGHSH
jgi:Fur family ferric uptake transcriptional regulator